MRQGEGASKHISATGELFSSMMRPSVALGTCLTSHTNKAQESNLSGMPILPTRLYKNDSVVVRVYSSVRLLLASQPAVVKDARWGDGVCVCATAVGLAARSGEKCTGVMGSAQITSQCVKGIGPDQIRSDPLCVAERCAATLLVPHRTLPLRSSRNSCFHQGVSRLRQNQERSDPRKVTKSTTAAGRLANGLRQRIRRRRKSWNWPWSGGQVVRWF